MESRRRDWNRTSIIVLDSYKVPRTSPYQSRTLLFGYIKMTKLRKVSVSCFRTFIDLLRCGCLAQSDCAAYCVPFRFACAGNSCPAWFILSACTAFATLEYALAGLPLLSILGRRSWIVSLAPSYMPFFCVSIIQRAFLLCGRKRSRTAETIRGSGVRKKLATQKIRTPLHTIPGAHRTFQPC